MVVIGKNIIELLRIKSQLEIGCKYKWDDKAEDVIIPWKV